MHTSSCNTQTNAQEWWHIADIGILWCHASICFQRDIPHGYNLHPTSNQHFASGNIQTHFMNDPLRVYTIQFVHISWAQSSKFDCWKNTVNSASRQMSLRFLTSSCRYSPISLLDPFITIVWISIYSKKQEESVVEKMAIARPLPQDRISKISLNEMRTNDSSWDLRFWRRRVWSGCLMANSQPWYRRQLPTPQGK